MMELDLIEDKDDDILNLETNPKIEPILFGAEISLNIADKPELFLYSDGFIDTKVCCVNILNANKNIISFGNPNFLPQKPLWPKKKFPITPSNRLRADGIQNPPFQERFPLQIPQRPKRQRNGEDNPRKGPIRAQKEA